MNKVHFKKKGKTNSRVLRVSKKFSKQTSETANGERVFQNWWEGLPKLWTDLELLLPWSSLMLMDLATKNSKARLHRILTPWTGQKQQAFELWPASKSNSITHVPFTSKPLPASSQHTWLLSSVNACPTGFPQHCTWRLVDLPILGPLQFTYVYYFVRHSGYFRVLSFHLDSFGSNVVHVTQISAFFRGTAPRKWFRATTA